MILLFGFLISTLLWLRVSYGTKPDVKSIDVFIESFILFPIMDAKSPMFDFLMVPRFLELFLLFESSGESSFLAPRIYLAFLIS